MIIVVAQCFFHNFSIIYVFYFTNLGLNLSKRLVQLCHQGERLLICLHVSINLVKQICECLDWMFMSSIFAVGTDSSFVRAFIVEANQVQRLLVLLTYQMPTQISLHNLVLQSRQLQQYTIYSFIIQLQLSSSLHKIYQHLIIFIPLLQFIICMSYQIIPLINTARSNPNRSGDQIYNDMKSSYHGNDLIAFGRRIQTFEGVRALEDLNNYMKGLKPTTKLVQSPALTKAAEEIATQKGQKGQIDNQKPIVISQKIQKTSKLDGKVCQLICLGTSNVDEIYSYFLIDDGLASRKRRRMLLDPTFKYIGIGSAKHTIYGTINVILLAQNVLQ